MKTHRSPDATQASGTKPITILETSLRNALETYSNVHRGSGHFSQATTRIYERARAIVSASVGKNNGHSFPVFCSPRLAAKLTAKMKPGTYSLRSTREQGLPLGVTAVIARAGDFPEGIPIQTGGGVTRVVATDWVLWARGTDRLEAGTPAIINSLALAKALQLTNGNGSSQLFSASAGVDTSQDIQPQDETEELTGFALLDLLRRTMPGRHLNVPTLLGERPFINFDHAASTPCFAPVMNTFFQAIKLPPASYPRIIEETRAGVADFLGAPESVYDVVFTSGTTEAVNLAAESLGLEPLGSEEPVILGSMLEHSSNDLPWRMVPRHTLIRLSVDKDGFFDMHELEHLLQDYNESAKYGKKRIKLVALSGASNILGTYSDLAAIADLAHRYGARLLVDAAQLVAHRPVNMENWGVDYLVFSGHKTYAPFGSGALVVRKGLLAFPMEEMVEIKASGEENVAGIAALGKALLLLKRIGFETIMAEERRLTMRLISGMSDIKGVTVTGVRDVMSPAFAFRGGVVMFGQKGSMPNTMAGYLSTGCGIGVRYGCHCAHIMVKRLAGVGPGLEQFQKVLLTLFPKINLPGFVRVSLGLGNSEEEVEWLLESLERRIIKEKEYPVTKQEVKRQTELFLRRVEQNVFGDG